MSNSAVAAIQYALENCDGDDDAVQFLEYWNTGDFDVIRRNWLDVPESVFAEADPLHEEYKKTQEDAEAVMQGVLDCVEQSEQVVGGGLPGHLLVRKNDHLSTILDVLMPDQSKYHLTLTKA